VQFTLSDLIHLEIDVADSASDMKISRSRQMSQIQNWVTGPIMDVFCKAFLIFILPILRSEVLA